MREIRVSTDVFARIWSLRQIGEDDENAILRRVLIVDEQSSSQIIKGAAVGSEGLVDRRFGVHFPEGFEIERSYLGVKYTATVTNRKWEVAGREGRYSNLNEISRAIGTKTENAWMNWFFVNDNGFLQQVSDLRDPAKVVKRNTNLVEEERGAIKAKRASESSRWCDDVKSALQSLGGKAPLSQIYIKVKEIRGTSGRSTPPTLQEIVRKELEMRSSDSEVYDVERGEDWFMMPDGKGQGVWAIR